MENTEKNKKSSSPAAFLFLIPALLFGIISMALAVVGLGLIPLLPALAGIVLCTASFFIFRKSYSLFTKIVMGISIVAVVISVFRGVIIEKKVATDATFDSTMVKSQEGIESDLNDAFGEDIFGLEEKGDTIK